MRRDRDDVGRPARAALDPRASGLRRVYTERTNCLYGSCVHSWYVCVGPDLYVHVTGTDDKTIPDSPRCREDVG